MRFLKNSIFVTAPSDSIYAEGDKIRLENAVKKFNDMDINVTIGKTVNKINQYSDDEYKEKALEVEEALLNDDIDTVIAANGGETESNILKYINFNMLRSENKKEKIFQGFSDNSILTFLLQILSGWRTYYAPCFPTFGYNNWDQTLYDNFELLKGNMIEQNSQNFFESKSFKKVKGKELYGYNLDTPSNLTEVKNIKSFSVEGTFLGGCLDVLKNLLNTEYDKMIEYNKNHQNIIWFIENCAMNISELEQVLDNMKKNNWFENVICFMIGRGKITLNQNFLNQQNELLIKVLSKYNVPIIVNCDFGHVRPFNTLITGGEAILTYNGNKYTIKYKNME